MQAGRDFVQAAGQPAVNVIKPKGGNWLTGNVEKQVGRMKMADEMTPEYYANRQRVLEEARAKGDDRTVRAISEDLEVSRRNDAINNWIDRNLTNYIKKEMGTPEDPVRRLAEEGILHIKPFGDQGTVSSRLQNKRMGAGFSPVGEGKSEAAKFWERQADISIDPYPAGSYKHGTLDEGLLEANPWLKNVPDEQMINYAKGINDLGFDHIVDVLRQDVRAGRIRPEQLSKVSMEQAVRRTYEFDQEMAKKMREAQIKATEGMPVHREYPEGYRWIELVTPSKLPEKFAVSEKNGRFNVVDSTTGDPLLLGRGQTLTSFGTPEEAVSAYYKQNPKVLEDALKYEGDTMGHCVGGYCPDVLEGRSRIYSLRDAKGEPHVTVEVEPAPKIGFREGEGPKTPEEKFDQQTEWMKGVESGRIGGDVTFAAWWRQKHGIPEPENPPQISQIKGKQNRAPKEEYLPFVQDFVRSGQWSKVGDLGNTGLIRTDAVRKAGWDIGDINQPFLTKQEYDDLLLRQLKPEGMKRGGKVSISDNPDAMMMDVEDRKMAEGGAAFGIYPRQRATPSSEETKKRAKQAAEIGAELVFPQDAVDVGMMLVPGGKIARKVGAALIAGGASTDADAGVLKILKKATAKEPSLPLNLPRAPAKTREEIRPVAQRMAEQMTGEFVRPNPKKSINPAGKSFKQFKMEQDLTHDIRPVEGKTLLPQQVADIEKQMGMLKIGVSGDTTIADKVLHRAGPYQLDIPSPQHGGPLYGLGGEGAWASNNPVAATFQKRVQELSQAHKDAPVLGQFLAMGPQGSNFAMHFADANLRAIDPSKMSKQQIEQVNKLIREGSEKSGPRPGFPGIEDKESAYLHFAFDPELRKHFNAVMQQPDYTSKLGLPDGRVILHAITEPELRNTEVLTSGLSQMRLNPSVNPADLALSAHPTYSHVIPKVPGSDITRTRYPVPAELEFPDVAEFIKKEYRPRDATRVYQTATPRQIIDQQHIDEMKMYEELMKQYTGKKEGGAVSKAAQIDGNEFVLAAQKYGLKDDISTLNKLVALVNQGATVDEAARVVAESVEMAGGGLPMVKAGLKEMMERIANRFGGYEAKRLERAADEVPNLESLYEPRSLERLFGGDNAKGIMTMRPEDFEKYSTKLPFDPKAKKQFVFDPEMDEKFPMGISQEDYIKYLANLKGFSDVPYLEVNTTPARLKPAPFITGHEGRHRNRAMVLSGQPTGIVQFAPRAELREPMPRRSREEYLQALNEELERTNRMVRPQKIDPKDKPRPLVQLPPVYKNGGDVNSGLIKVQKKRKVKA
jgi:hypothetical protein